jgi:outer membrane protein TolC
MNFFRNIFASSLIPCCALFSPLGALSEGSIQRVNPVDTSDLVLDSYPSPSSLKPISREELQNLEMSTAVRLAEERNPIIKENYQDFVASSNQLGAAYATWWPTITGDLNFGWYGQNAFYNYAGATSGIDTSIYGNSSELPTYLFDRSFTSSYLQGLSTIDLDWKIYDPSRQPLIDKNQSLLDQASSDYTISRRDYGLKTREAFVKLQTSLAGISTSSQLVENDRFLLRLAKSRKRLGVASDLDIAKQLTVLKTDEVNQVTAQRDARVAEAELAELLNDPLAIGIKPSTTLAPLGGWHVDLRETIESALDYRKVIEKQLAIVRQNEKQALIDLAVYKPTISLMNSLYWTKGVGYVNLGPPWIIGSARSDLWNAESLLKVTFTGFDGGKARMEAEASKSRARAAQSAVEQSQNGVISEVREYFADVKDGRQALIVATERVEAASSALKLQSLRFSAGFGSITDVVQSQQDLTQAVEAYIKELSDYNLALVSLSRASGIDYSEDLSLLQKVGDPLSQVKIAPYLVRSN